ncbi:MAG TPA: hypothetical protein V6D30_00700 [Leptolyngbyaceae cyanobacterium]
MTYKNQLHPWCIIRSLSNMRSRLIIRFRRRSDAEAHLQILRANNPTASYEIIFDVTPDPSDLKAKQELMQSYLEIE